MNEPYTTMSANGGEKTTLMVGWIVKTVFIDPDHAALSERVAELLNRDAGLESVPVGAGMEHDAEDDSQ